MTFLFFKDPKLFRENDQKNRKKPEKTEKSENKAKTSTGFWQKKGFEN